MRAGDGRARDELVTRYLPLAGRLARRYARRPEERDDLVQVAAIGLVKAVDRWEPDRGVDLASYAFPTVVGELRHYFRDSTWVIRPGRRLQESALAVYRAQDALRMRLGRDASVAELARELQCDDRTVLEALEAGALRAPASLDAPIQDGTVDPGTLGESIQCLDRELERVETRAMIDQLTAVLDARAREIIRLRYEEDLQQTEIATRVGCTQPHVSGILRAAMEKLQAYAATAMCPAPSSATAQAG